MTSMTKRSTYTKELTDEIANTPPEYLPMLLRIVRSYRESVTLLPAKESLRRGWKEMYEGELIVHEVERPARIDLGLHQDRRACSDRPAPSLALANRQPFLAVEPIDAVDA